MLPSFTANGFLPVGRYSVSLEDAHSLLVGAPEFGDSVTRATLWEGLLTYLGRFADLEDTYTADLDGLVLVHRLWLGGSYVSAKRDPRNIDATLLIDLRAEARVCGRPGSKWLTTAFKSRQNMAAKFGVAPLRVGYRPIAHVFQPEHFSTGERTYFMERGLWDDWWQRCRLPDQSDRSPSVESAVPARGYLEVRL
ncbi:hypothetical protein [Streptomyces sp. NPDC047000]|uniref:DUF6932 family protein n=1 Tax=Streptomyces sp. NPDC047000 TaxID=3155474 RepID=UPI0033F67E9A